MNHYINILPKQGYTIAILICCLLSTNLFAQVQPPNPQDCNSGNATGNAVTTVDGNSNFYAGNPQLTGGALVLSDNNGDADTYEFSTTITPTDLICDNYYNTGGSANGVNPNPNAFPEGPDLQIQIPVPASKQESCAGGEITIILRGDFNNTCEVAYLADESGTVLGQSQVTGFNENESCAQPIGVALTVPLTAAGLKAAAADGVINLQIRTNGSASGLPNGFSGAQVDGTCHTGGRTQDTDGVAGSDGVCMQVQSFTWEIQTLEVPTIDEPVQEICSGETVTFNASCPGCTFTNPTVNWYNASTGGTLVATGSSFSPVTGDLAAEGTFANPNLTNTPLTYTFFAENSCPAGCITNRTPVSVTVYPQLFISCPSDYLIQCIEDTITSFTNNTQFINAGGAIGEGCGEVTFKCVSQTIE